jgi:hypothetical protein
LKVDVDDEPFFADGATKWLVNKAKSSSLT